MAYETIFFFIYFFLIKIVIEKSTSFEILFKREPSSINNDFILSNYNIDIYISFQIGTDKKNLDKVFLKSDTHEFMLSNFCNSKYMLNYHHLLKNSIFKKL